MIVIKTILQALNQESSIIFQKKGQKRYTDQITKTRQLINYWLYTSCGYNSKSIQRHLRPISDGFDHATVFHSIKTIRNQLYFYLPELDKIIPAINKANDKRTLSKFN